MDIGVGPVAPVVREFELLRCELACLTDPKQLLADRLRCALVEHDLVDGPPGMHDVPLADGGLGDVQRPATGKHTGCECDQHHSEQGRAGWETRFG